MNLKMTVEIKDDHFCFEHEVGKCRHAGSQPISPEGLFLFTDLLAHLNKHASEKESKRHKAFEAYCFAQAYPELMKEVEGFTKKK